MKLKKYLFLLALQASAVFAQNDECDNATEIPLVSNYCSAAGAFNNNAATPSGFGAASCWQNNVGNDVWFKFTTIATDVTVTVNGNVNGNGTLNAPKAALYGGDCGGTINELSCQTAGAMSNTVSLYKGGLSIGSVYYIRVSAANNNKGTFQLCVNNYTPTVKPGQDCEDAAYICNKNPVSITSVSGAGKDNNEAKGTCLDVGLGNVESNTTWYTWEASNNGTLTFLLKPGSPDDDVDFAFFEIPPTGCKDKKLIRCSAAGSLKGISYDCLGETGLNFTSTDISEPQGCDPPNDKFVKFIDQEAGKTYALLIEGFNNSNGSVNMSFDGTGEFKGPKPGFTISPGTVCLGKSVTITNTSADALTYLWDFGAGANPATSNTAGPHEVTYSSPGTKTVVLTVTGKGGCMVTSVQKVLVEPCAIQVSVKDTAACPAQCVPLTATSASSGPITYSWSNGSTGQSIVVCPTVTSTYTVTATGSFGTTVTATAKVTIHELPLINAGPDVSICAGISTTLTASGGVSYSWNPVTGLSSSTGATVIAAPSSTTTYTLTSENIYGCTNTDNVTVSVLPGVKGKVSADVSICPGQSQTLTAEGGSSFAWSPPAGLNPSTGPIVTAAPSVTTTYTVIISNGPCTPDTQRVTVTVHGLPKAGFEDTAGCAPLKATLINTSTGATTCSWYFSHDGSTSKDQHPQKNYDKPGTYAVKLVVTSLYGCKDSIVKNAVVVHPDPVASFVATPKLTSIWNPDIHFESTAAGAVQWLWSFGDDSTSAAARVTHRYQDTGRYQVCLEVENAQKCRNRNCAEVIVQPDWTLYVPNAFTPNGDGVNDFFIGYGTFVREYEMWIFDRWGNLVYHCNDMSKPWNGALDNKNNSADGILQIDTYVYKIRIKDIFNKKHQYHGHVNLIR